MKMKMRISLMTLGLLSLANFAQAADSGSDIAPTASLRTETSALEGSHKATKLELKAGVMGRSLEDEVVNSKYAGGTIDINAERTLIKDYLAARLNLSVIMTSGSYTNQYPDSGEGKAPTAFNINEAALAFTPASFLKFEAGVLLTQFSSIPSNFEALGFPGAKETIEVGNDDFKIATFAMQAIPTSDTAAVKSGESGVSSQLQLIGVNFSTDPKDKKDFGLAASVVRYDFKNLNTSAATDSRTLGNTVSADGPQARFMYEFGGYESSANMAYQMTKRLKATMSGSYIKNEKAPDLFNKGYLYSAGLSTPVAGSEIAFTGGYFYNESDTLPASYTSTGKGSNNRFGNVYRLSMENKKDKINGFVQYTKANEIEDRPYTADREIIVFGLEVAYEIL